MVILEAGNRRRRAENIDPNQPFADHPHFSPDAVAARRATHARLRGGH